MSSNDRIPGSAARVVLPPGNHVHPKWDMKAFRRRQTRKPKKGTPALPLAPMIDMLSVLVLFLLTNFSTTGEVYFKSYKVAIPEAQHGRDMQTNPLVSIAGPTVGFDMDRADEAPMSFEDSGADLPKLRAALKVARALDLKIRPGQEFRGQVNLQADDRATMVQVKRVMNLLIEEGWSAINFVVLKKASLASEHAE